MERKEHLTPKQQTFAQAYAYTNNIGLAEQRAGYQKGVGKKMMKTHPNLIQAIDQYRKQMIQQYVAHYQFCVKQYKEILQKAKKQKDYSLASTIIQKLSKLRQPMLGNNTNTNEIKIVIGT